MSPIQNIESIMGPVASAEMREFIEADAEKPLQRQGALHSQLLGQFFAGFYVTPADKRLRNAALTQIARLHALIDRGAPILENRIECETLDPLEIVRERLGGFIGFMWPAEFAPLMDVLLREYHRNGYLDLTDMEIPHPTGMNPVTHLELAILKSNLNAATTLIELGAARESVPARDFKIARLGQQITVVAGDFDALVDILYSTSTLQMRAAIDEGVRRRLAIDMTAAIEDRRVIEPLARPDSHVQRRARL